MTGRVIAKWALFLSGLSTLLIAIVLSGVYALLATQGGSRWLLNKALPFQSNDISWQSIEGTLMDGLRLSEVQAKLPDLQVSAHKLSGKWDLLSILGGQFQIEQLYAKDLIIIDKSNPESTKAAAWPVIHSPIPINISDLSLEQIIVHSAETETRIASIHFVGSIGLLSNQIKQLSLRQSKQWLEASGKLGARPPYKLNLQLNWHTELKEGVALNGASEIKGSLAEIKLEHRSTVPFVFSLSGNIATGFNQEKAALDWRALSADLKAKWQIDNWLAPGYGQNINSSGQLCLQGTLHDYRIQSQFDFLTQQMGGLPKLQIALNANGDMEAMRLQQLSVESAATNIRAQGDISWKHDPTWSLALDGEKINPGYFWPDWAGDITARLNSQGSVTSQGLALMAQIEQMEGTLRGYPLAATGKVGYNVGVFSATDLHLKQGNNQLVLDASFENSLQANWTLTANDLAAIYPGLQGKIQSTGSLLGSVQNPQFNAEITAQSLAYEEIVIASLNANLSSEDAATYQLSADASDFAIGAQMPMQLSLSATGSKASHRYQLAAKQADLAVILKATGAWREQQWMSHLASADIDSETLGQWRLVESTQLSLQKNRINLALSCWVQTANEICIEGHYAEKTGLNLEAAINRLELATFNPHLPTGAQISGELKGALALSGAFGKLNGKLNLITDNARLVLNQPEAKPNRVELRAININALLTDNTLSLNGTARLLETGFAQGHLSFPLNQPDAPLNGEIIAQFSELSWLDPFVTFLSDLHGKADVAIQLAGSLNQPLLSGKASLEQLSAFVPRLGVNLKNGILAVNSQGVHDWTLTGQLDSGEGTVRLDGAATLTSLTDWQSRLSIDGQALQTLGLENIKAQISPALVIEADPRQLKVIGKIKIPQAEINLKELPPSTVSVSQDEIILDTPEAPESQQPTLAIYTDVSIILGEKIAFKGFGITGALAGNLRLREEPERPLRIDGIVEIPEGFYKAYGQKLTINPGRLIFQGPPENPAIDVRASRQVGETTVGIQIGGTAEALSSELYSMPALPPTETMALLITGKPLNNATQADASMLMSAVTSLGITQSAGLTQRLQRSFGLDVLALSSNGGIEQSAVTIGKYLTPKLFVSYVQDILSPNASVNLEYSLSEKLKVKAESGATQSMDILYRIQR